MNIDDKDKGVGLYQKFQVRRLDGRSRKGQKHHGCEYFVLDLQHDPHAIAALTAYSDSCAESYPALSNDLKRKIFQLENKQQEPKA